MLIGGRTTRPLVKSAGTIFSRAFFSINSYVLKGHSASSSRWLQRQGQDKFTKEAKVRNYLSRAAFKLLALNDRYKLFKPGQTVVDLGFAPGAWSQVAVEKTNPGGRVIGVDILNHPPPPGASAIQGNFLSYTVHEKLRQMLQNPQIGRDPTTTEQGHITDVDPDYPVDVVLSDMCAPLPQITGFTSRSINDPYIRMANTSGLAVRDHGNSIVSAAFLKPKSIGPLYDRVWCSTKRPMLLLLFLGEILSCQLAL
jgi:21S rRNA (uridine2791-2'-O)-methyltransferase